MNESSSSSHSERTVFHYGEVISIPICHCGKQLNLKTAWTNDNPGRRYWECGPKKVSSVYCLIFFKKNYAWTSLISFVQGMNVVGCGFIRWFDPPMCARAMKIIPGLLRRINKNEEEIVALKSKLQARGCVDAKGVDAKRVYNKKALMAIVVVISIIVLVLSYLVATIEVGETIVHRLPLA